MEKSLPVTGGHQRAPNPATPLRRRACILPIAGIVFLWLFLIQVWHHDSVFGFFNRHLSFGAGKELASESRCVQPPAMYPPTDNAQLNGMYEYLSSSDFANASITRLSEAIQVRTESFDDLGPVGEDPRWDVFYKFHDYLEKTFPKIHDNLRVEKVNTHGLLYTWTGSDEQLKPTLLMAHQDVVPVPDATLDSWTHPPFDGVFDGKYIWGRGSTDCKSPLMAIMETVETLLNAGFEPQRTILLSFGFDEECKGTQGAGHLAPYLFDRYGENGVGVIVDEGMGYSEAFGRGFAVPAVAEKGYTDVDITVRTPGGHSSIPPDHTSIGIISELITKIEAYQYDTYLADLNPFLGYLHCSAEYSPKFPDKLRKLLNQHRDPKSCHAAKKHDTLALEAAKISREAKYLMQTSQAVDLINGGVKTNALPESVRTTVNHRINIGDEPETVWDHLRQVAAPIAKKYNLTLHAFDGQAEAYNSISLSHGNSTLRAAPVTPTDTDILTPYAVLASTIRALYGEETIVAPALMTGNTDTRYYWDLTRHIFRFGPGYVGEPMDGLGNAHTVDEKVTLTNHIHAIKWFTLFIRNMDQVKLEA